MPLVADPKSAKLNATEFKRAYDNVISYYINTIAKVKSLPINLKDKDAVAQRDAFIKQLESELATFKKDAETKSEMIAVIDRLSKSYKIGSATMLKYLKDNDKGIADWGKENLDILKERADTVER